MAKAADFVFLIDGTGSMKPCMDALKENISIFFDTLADPQNPVSDWRGKVVAYRDQKVDGSQWFEDNDFVSNDEAALKAQLNTLEAAGGGDEPESALDAIHKLATMPVTPTDAQEIPQGSWRNNVSRVIILFTDATYHPNMTYGEGEGGDINDVRTAIHTNGIILVFYAPDHDLWDEVDTIDKADFQQIAGPDFVRGLKDFVSDKDNFKKVMEALAKSISQSVAVEVL